MGDYRVCDGPTGLLSVPDLYIALQRAHFGYNFAATIFADFVLISAK